MPAGYMYILIFIIVNFITIIHYYNYQGNEDTTEAAKPDEASSPEKAVSLNLVQQETACALHLPAPVA